MAGDSLVFFDETTDIEALVAEAKHRMRRLSPNDVELTAAAQAREGEVWSPQLLPYEEWVSEHAGEASASTEMLEGQEIGLIYTGAYSMGGISDEELNSVLERAMAGSHLARPESSAVLAPRLNGGSGDELSIRDVVSVREDEGGYALSGFDLKGLARAMGADDDLVVVLPAFVGDIPIVRITAEAFARRYVQGVGVRALIVPDTVVRIDADAFSAVSAGHIHLGSGVERMGDMPCDLAGVSPRLGRRAYSVDSENTHYSSTDGNLLTKDGTKLLFIAPPYSSDFIISAGVREIGPVALCAGCEPPRIVRCPETLDRVAARGWDDAVWICSPASRVGVALAARGVRLASDGVVQSDDCFYDFNDEGALLVAGPAAPKSISKRFAEAAAARHAGMADQSPSAAIKQAAPPARTMLSLPSEVCGRPLVRIGVRALPFAPETVVLPDTVRTIERDNACKGTKRLVLPEGLESIGAHSFCSRAFDGAVVIPKSVRFVGEGCFEYAVCRLAHTGSTVHVSADQLLSCFCESGEDGVPFDYARYDELLLSGKNLPDRLGALISRVTDPHRAPDEVRFALVERLRERGSDARKRVAQNGDRDEVAALLEAGFIDDATFDEQIELLRSCNRADCVLFLMEEHRRSNAGVSQPSSSSRARFAL